MFPPFGNFLWDSSNRITPRRSGQNAQRVIECKYAAAAKGEISFFISRGRDFGIAMDEGALFAHYARRLSVYAGKAVSVEQLMKEHSASSLLTAFLYWAEDLKDAPYERVEGIFCQMAQAARALC